MKFSGSACFVYCIVSVLGQFGCGAAGERSVSAPSAPSGPSSSPASSTFYGPGIGSDGLANTTLGPFGNMVSYRIRAKHSGILEGFLIYLIPDHADYAGGTGGTIHVTLNTDDGTSEHNPSSTVLASSRITDVLSLPFMPRHFYSVTFSASPAIASGQLYHLVFKNEDADPTLNFLSVDNLYQAVPVTPSQPTISNVDQAVLLSNDGRTWGTRTGYTPIYELHLTDGIREGVGYIGGWVGAPRPVSGKNAVREMFTVTGSEVKVTSAAIRLARVSGIDPLVVRLEDADGALIERGEIPAGDIPQTSEANPVWAKFAFAATHTLLPGHTYYLDFEATSTSTYEVFPIQKGGAYGFDDATYFKDGHAEFIESGSWAGWTQWGVANRTDGDLQFYFNVVP
jgi:hypothetical protein